MRVEEYRHRIEWLWSRAQEFQVLSKCIHHQGSRAAMARLAQTYANAACELEDLLERKLNLERRMRRRPNLRVVASGGARVEG